MKKDKKTNTHFLSSQERLSSSFLKKVFIFSILGITFSIAIIILIYRYVNSTIVHPPLVVHESASQAAPPLPSEAAPALVSQLAHLENEMAIQSNRLTSLENTLNHLSIASPMLSKIIVYEMVNNILEDLLPVHTLIAYLQKHPEPWAVDILHSLAPIKEVKTYAELQALFIIPSAPKSPFTWKHIKNIFRSFVNIRKIDNKGNYIEENIDDIKVALNEHKIQRALTIFDKLSPEIQAQLVNWQQAAQDRLALERIKQKILLELSEG